MRSRLIGVFVGLAQCYYYAFVAWRYRHAKGPLAWNRFGNRACCAMASSGIAADAPTTKPAMGTVGPGVPAFVVRPGYRVTIAVPHGNGLDQCAVSHDGSQRHALHR